MLLHGLIDVAVDELMEIAEEFRFQLDVLEGQALLKPDPLLVRHRACRQMYLLDDDSCRSASSLTLLQFTSSAPSF